MKKKLLASLLVSSAVVGASLAPLSAQATTTGTTPVTVGFEGGTLPNQDNNDGGNTDPDLTKPNTNFDLLYIPKVFAFPSIKLGEDQFSIKIPSTEMSKSIGVGDVRGTKTGWQVTGEIKELSNETEKLAGEFNFGLIPYYAQYIILDTVGSYYGETATLNGVKIMDDTTAPSFSGTNIKIGGGASIIIEAAAGKGQGMWSGHFKDFALNVTTPYQQIKTGNYTGNITWNLVAGPSTPAPAN